MPKLFFHLNFGVVRGRCLKIVQSEYLTWANNYYLESLYRCHMFNLHFFVAEKYVTFQCDAIKESEMINLIKKNKTKYWYEQKIAQSLSDFLHVYRDWYINQVYAIQDKFIVA